MAFVGQALLSATFQLINNELVSPVIKEFKTRWGIDKDLKRLARMLPKIQAVLDDAEQKETSDPFVKEWLKDLTDVAYDIQDIMDDLAYEAERSKIDGETETETGMNQVWNLISPKFTKFSLSEQVDGVMERLEEIKKDMESLGLSERVGRRWLGKTGRLPTTSLIDESKFVGREDDTNEIIELLLKPSTRNNVSVISIVGMGGLGKTTLAQHVFADQKVKDHFAIKAWVCVSDEFDVRRLTQAILESVSRTNFDLKELDTLQVTLKDKLEGKRFLLILDDVWNEEHQKWELLRAPLLFGASESKILITTRSEKVAKITGGADSVNHLRVLSYEQCYSLFMQCAFPEGNSSDYPHLEFIGSEIVKKCKGLPLAAKTLGLLLYSQVNEDEWKYVLQSEMWNLPVGSSYILPALRLSYHHLPSHLKQCFAYCSLFPKDYLFLRETLVQLWMAEGYVQSKGTKCLEDVGGDYFDALFSRCFFQQHAANYGEGRYFVMHDLVHDLAQSVSSEELNCTITRDNLSINISQRTRHLSFSKRLKLEGIANLEVLYKAKSLRTILSLQKVRWHSPHDFFQKLKYLRVLDLDLTDIDEIPDSVCNLRQLRYLNLNGTNIKMLPESIGRLFNLQTLMLRGCKGLKELPNSMGNLKQLRELDLFCTAIPTLPESLGSLSNLQTLKLQFCKGLKELPNSMSNLKLLRDLDLSSTAIPTLPESFGSLSNLQTLKLQFCKGLKELPNSMGNLKQLGDLDLSSTAIPTLPESLGSLSNLQTLKLHGCKGLKELKNSMGNLKQLQYLDLSFTAIPTLPESLGSLSNLQTLKLNGCKGLKELPNSIGNLKHLKHIDVSSTLIQRLPESIGSLSNLQELILADCNRLHELPQNLGNLIRLRNLDNKSCEELVSIPLGIGKLTSLEKLHLFVASGESGAKLGELKELEKLKGELHISGLQNVNNADEAKDAALKDKQYLQCLTLEWGDVNGNLQQHSIEELVFENLQPHTNLEELRIKGFNCGSRFPNWMGDPSSSKLRSLTVEGNGECCKVLPLVGKLQFLKYLRISQMRGLKPSLEELFVGEVKGFPSLEILYLNGLSDLEELFCVEDKYEFLCLRELTIRNCQKLRKLPDAFSALKELSIISCDVLMVLPRLPALCKLHINSCRKQTTFPEGFMGAHITQPTAASSSSSTQTNRWLLPAMLEHLQISRCYNLESLSLQAFTSLKTIIIFSCPKLVSLPKGLKNLTSLESLSISYCNELESLPEDGLPNSLLTIKIIKCKLLSTRCKEGGEDWPKIAHISNKRIT